MNAQVSLAQFASAANLAAVWQALKSHPLCREDFKATVHAGASTFYYYHANSAMRPTTLVGWNKLYLENCVHRLATLPAATATTTPTTTTADPSPSIDPLPYDTFPSTNNGNVHINTDAAPSQLPPELVPQSTRRDTTATATATASTTTTTTDATTPVVAPSGKSLEFRMAQLETRVQDLEEQLYWAVSVIRGWMDNA